MRRLDAGWPNYAFKGTAMVAQPAPACFTSDSGTRQNSVPDD